MRFELLKRWRRSPTIETCGLSAADAASISDCAAWATNDRRRDGGVGVVGGGQRVLLGLGQAHGNLRPGERCRHLAGHLPVHGAGGHYAALGRHAFRSRLCEPGLGLRHIGARHLAYLEPVHRGLELAAHHPLAAAAVLDLGQIAEHVHVGGHRVEQDRLLDRLELRPRPR